MSYEFFGGPMDGTWLEVNGASFHKVYIHADWMLPLLPPLSERECRNSAGRKETHLYARSNRGYEYRGKQ